MLDFIRIPFWKTIILSAGLFFLAACNPLETSSIAKAQPSPEEVPSGGLIEPVISKEYPWLPGDLDFASPPRQREAASLSIEVPPGVDLDNPTAVFSAVFSALPKEVLIRPSENYLYWRFKTDEKNIWGNLRIGTSKHDTGIVHIGYYEYNEKMSGPADANVRYAALSEKEGVVSKALDRLQYVVEHKGKEIYFALNDLAQDPPARFKISDNERFVFNTEDESGVGFHLMFDGTHDNFMFIANEDETPLESLIPITENLVVDSGSGFAFYRDRKNEDRKLLVGVFRPNITKNTYFDGPADQLADNQIPNVSAYKGYLNRAYPFTTGVIDEYGFYLAEPGNRIAVAPYYAYNSAKELAGMLDVCERLETTADILACMIPDGMHKKFASTKDDTSEIHGGIHGNEAEKGLVGEQWINSLILSGDKGLESGEILASIHAGAVTWHLPNQTFIPDGSKHAAAITWHIGDTTFVPSGAVHNTGTTWHREGQTFIPAGSKHAAGITWHLPDISFIPSGSRHAAAITWHIEASTFIPAGSRHAAGITWHIPNTTFIPRGSRHAAGVTWHIPGTTFIPPGGAHAAGVTWHMPGLTFIPPGSRHAAGVTWHVPGLTFIPPGGAHAAGVTWHMPGLTFIPPGGRHAAGVTWHIPGTTFIPPGARHAAGITWHIPGVTFIPPGTRHAAGVTWHTPGLTFIPPGARHAAGITWHIPGTTFIPASGRHAAGVTWHIPGTTFIPPGGKHAAGITWHVPGATFIPPGSKHVAGTTWHVAGTTFVPPGPVHVVGMTWHTPGVSDVPPGAVHNTGSTWHYKDQTFIPPGTVHNTGSTWHYDGQSFIPAGTRHNTGASWHVSGTSFIPR